MRWLDTLARAIGYIPRRARRAAAFPGAQVGRLTSSWTTDPGAVNRWIRWEGRTLRARARSLARSDAYAAKFVSSVINNVGGPKPFTMRARIRKPRGQLDTVVNKRMEAEWRKFCKAEECDVAGKMSMSAFHRAHLFQLATDGEFITRIYPGEGRYGLRLQNLDIERLDSDRNETLGNGRSIKCGIEMDRFGRPLAYYILKAHPGEQGLWGGMQPPRDTTRVPADQIIHFFIPHWPEQARGITMLHAAMLRLWHLGGFEEAAVVNARVGASKVAVIYSADGANNETLATGADSQGNLLDDTTPGQYWNLPDGKQLGSWNPSFPDQAVEPFIRACLRGAAAGLGVAYHSFANDPSNVNYSTARVALLEERDYWMTLQELYAEHVCSKIHAAWLAYGSLTKAVPPEWSDERFSTVEWQGKRWSWVDPMKETSANVAAVDGKLTSRTRLLSEEGIDFEDILEEIAQENELADELGVELTPPEPTTSSTAPGKQAPAKEPEEPDDGASASETSTASD